MHECYRQTDRQTYDRRQTDGRATAYGECEREFTFAKNYTSARVNSKYGSGKIRRYLWHVLVDGCRQQANEKSTASFYANYRVIN